VITVICGGVGAARFLRALAREVDPRDIQAIINVGDDLVMHGLTICPDIDTISYTLSGLNDDVRGWGLTDESWRVMNELGELGGENWFSLGDRDLATHLYRSQRLQNGATKSEVTTEIACRRGIEINLIPATDDPIATMLESEVGELTFQEYFVKHHHGVAVNAVRYDGASTATPSAAAIQAIREADRIVIAPSNPILSIAPIVAMTPLLDALIARRVDVVAISPFIGGAALKGPADRLMKELGHDATNASVAQYYSRYASTLIIDEVDSHDLEAVQSVGLDVRVTTTLMNDPEHARALVRTALA
jgi:LPPG:FO 2-phospho-L-lactate transferase